MAIGITVLAGKILVGGVLLYINRSQRLIDVAWRYSSRHGRRS